MRLLVGLSKSAFLNQLIKVKERTAAPTDGGSRFRLGHGYVTDDGWDGWVLGSELSETPEVEILVGRFLGLCSSSPKADKGLRI
jgi:hypothetical protein